VASVDSSEFDSDDDDDDEGSSDEDEFCTPQQSPLSTPVAGSLNAAGASSPMAALDLGAAAGAGGGSGAFLPPSTPQASVRLARPSWCRPYWRHATRCIILLKSRGSSRMDWASVREFGADRKRYSTLWMRAHNASLISSSSASAKSKAAARAASSSWLPPLGTLEGAELSALERKLAFEAIVVFRGIAEQQWRLQQAAAAALAAKQQADAGKRGTGAGAEPSSAASSAAASAASSAPSSAVGAAAAAPAKRGGFWGYLGFKGAGEASSLGTLDAEAAKLLASIELTPEQQRRIWEQEQSLHVLQATTGARAAVRSGSQTHPAAVETVPRTIERGRRRHG